MYIQGGGDGQATSGSGSTNNLPLTAIAETYRFLNQDGSHFHLIGLQNNSDYLSSLNPDNNNNHPNNNRSENSSSLKGIGHSLEDLLSNHPYHPVSPKTLQ